MKAAILLTASVFTIACNSQPRNTTQKAVVASNQQRVGGPCETCELIAVGMPQFIDAVDSSAGWNEGDQRLIVDGLVLMPDGKTPAQNVILYYWQTNSEGRYAPSSQVPNSNNRHGHLRGWVKPDRLGKFTIYTCRPGSYPNDNVEAHIHVLVKEPQLADPYYIDDWVFEDDPLLTAAKRASRENRGGNGIQQVNNQNGVQIISPTIVLGKNIPGYPLKK